MSVQSMLLSGFASLPHCRLVLARFADASEARERLLGLHAQIAWGKPAALLSTVVQLALTPRGLIGLGVDPQALPFAFRDPLASPHHRALLGDDGPSAPERWAFNGDDADLIMLIYADSAARLQRCADSACAGLRVLAQRDTVKLDNSREHFGFADGLTDPSKTTALGEFVMGHVDESGERAPSPTHAGQALGEHGSYLVVRLLEQDVRRFWARLGELDDDPVGLAAKLIGRWPDGRRLAPEPGYQSDPHGLACPRGAHIRRANPGLAFARSVARHQLLRRGRPYGPPAPADWYPPGVSVRAGDMPADPEAERGLMFACLCADISRQFEHVQQSWLDNAKYDGLSAEVCPITSAFGSLGDARRFTIPAIPVRRRIHDWPQVVRTRGAAYGLLIGGDALLRLAVN